MTVCSFGKKFPGKNSPRGSGSIMDDLLQLLPSSTLLPDIEPHLALSPLASSHFLRATITTCEENYRQKYMTAIQNEKNATIIQNVQVEKALREGKEKREVRRLKNRLSAVRSRARKEAESSLNTYRLKSLEAQVQFLSSKLLQQRDGVGEKKK